MIIMEINFNDLIPLITGGSTATIAGLLLWIIKKGSWEIPTRWVGRKILSPLLNAGLARPEKEDPFATVCHCVDVIIDEIQKGKNK
jgi:hypothetical protein